MEANHSCVKFAEEPSAAMTEPLTGSPNNEVHATQDLGRILYVYIANNWKIHRESRCCSLGN